MNVADVFKNLLIDTWYKAVMYLGGGIFATSLFLPVHGLTSQQVQLISSGAFFIGMGEWKSHKPYSFVTPPNAYRGGAAVVSGVSRKPDLLSWIFSLVGAMLLLFGIWKIFHI